MSDVLNERARILAEYGRRDRALAGEYSLTEPAILFEYCHAIRALSSLLERAGLLPLADKRILEVGCGTGGWLQYLMLMGAGPRDLSGIDLCPHRIAAARERAAGCDLRTGCASELPWPDESFDIVLQSTVFTSILHAGLRRAIAAEMVRVLKGAGAIAWFDFRLKKPGNTQVRAIRAREIRDLFPGCEVTLVPVVLAPPLARRIAPHAWWLAEILHCCPLLRTHYMGLIRKCE